MLPATVAPKHLCYRIMLIILANLCQNIYKKISITV